MPPRETISDRVTVGLAVAAIAFAAVSFAGPWWVLNLQYSDTASFGMTSLNATYSFGPFGWNRTYETTLAGRPGTQLSGNQSDYSLLPAVGRALTLGATIAAVGLAAEVLGLGLLVRPRWMRQRPRARDAIGFLGFVLLLSAALTEVFVLPPAILQDPVANRLGGNLVSGFWGARTLGLTPPTSAYSWGAGWGWYVLVLAALLALAAAVRSLQARSRALAASRDGSPAPTDRSP